MDAPKLAHQLRELERQRDVLREVENALAVIEDSKFAKVGALWRAIAAVISRAPRRQREITEGYRGTASVSPSAAVSYDARVRSLSPSATELKRMRAGLRHLAFQPRISIVMPVFNPDESHLRAAIESIEQQVYYNWELCVADDGSAPAIRTILAQYAQKDDRIKLVLRSENGGISRASNSALDLATGEYVGFVDHDDLLSVDALYEVVRILNDDPGVDMIYSDEDKISDSGSFHSPFFKPDWCPDSFLSRMYTCHFTVYRRGILEEVGRLRPDFDGSQDYDLALRITERTERIRHVPKVLYHWRAHEGSTAHDSGVKRYAQHAAVRALNEALTRRGEDGVSAPVTGCPGVFITRYAIRRRERVSVLIPTRNQPTKLDRCVNSILNRSAYDDLEILILDNGSDEPEAIRSLEKWKNADARIKVSRYDVPFNYSRINNYAVSQATGAYLLFLNDDTEVISNGWIEAMVEYAQRPSIGAVGSLLLYPDGTVQHAGVVIGLGGVAGHSHKYYPGDVPGYFYMLKSVNNYSAVTGACMMVERTKFDRVGGFDESLAVAFNDVDLCLKLGTAGYRNVYLPHVKLYHHESASRGRETTPEKQARFQREMDLMIRRWRTDRYADPCYNPNLTIDREDFSVRA